MLETCMIWNRDHCFIWQCLDACSRLGSWKCTVRVFPVVNLSEACGIRELRCRAWPPSCQNLSLNLTYVTFAD